MRRATTVLIGLLVLVIVTGGCARFRSDADISKDIQAKMFSDPQLRDTNINVAVQGHMVTLTGTAPTDAARQEAHMLALNTPGVTSVLDQVTIAAPQSAQAAPPPAQSASPPAPERKMERKRARTTAMTHKAAPAPAPAPETAPPPPVETTDAAPVAQPAPAPPALPPPPPQPVDMTVAAGTTVTIVTTDQIDSSTARPGQTFHAVLQSPLTSGNQVVVPKGADVQLKLVNSTSAGHYSGSSALDVQLAQLTYNGKTYPLASNSYEVKGSSRGKNSALKIGGGAALGALIGAIAGGGKGAAIGAGAGAGAGTIYQGATKGQQVKIPSETVINFRLASDLTIPVMPNSQSSASSNQ